MKRDGFTIIEMFVVIGITAILAAVSMNLAKNARENAFDVECKSNLHELAAACTRYAMETGEFPWGMKTVKGYSSYCWDFVRKTGSSVWEIGDMWSGYSAKSIVSCPKCRREKDNWDGNGLTGYNYNCSFVGKVEGDPGARKKPLKWKAVKRFDKLLLFGDAGYAGGMNKFMRSPVSANLYDTSSTGVRQAGTQSFRHRGRTNLAFADGHVESRSQAYVLGGKKGFVSENTKTGFVAPDNSIYGEEGLTE